MLWDSGSKCCQCQRAQQPPAGATTLLYLPPLSPSLPLSLSPSLPHCLPSLSHPALSRVQLNILTICLRLHLSPAFLCHHFCHTCVYVCGCIGVHVCVCVCALVCLAFLSIWTHASLSLLNSLFLVFEIDLMLLFYLLCQQARTPPPHTRSLRTPTLTAACKLQRATWLKKKNLAIVSFPIDLYSATGTAACNFIQTLLHLCPLSPLLFAETSCLP